MDNMTYLDQIAAQSQHVDNPSESSLSSLFTPKRIALLAGAILLFILLAIVGSILGNISHKEQDLVSQANTRCANLSAVLTEYNSSLKFSNLRALSSSLSGILAETQRNLSTSLSEDFSQSTGSSAVSEEEVNLIEELKATLNTARLNDQLDRTFVREIELQISLLITIESEALERTKKSNLQGYLSSSISSLTTLHNQFENIDTSKL